MVSSRISRIVLVEDQIIFRELLAEVLAASGRAEVVAQLGEGKKALEVCRTVLPDLVLLDAVLPDTTGIEVLRGLLAWKQSLKVMLVTAHARPSLVQEAIELGARGFLTKDTPLAELSLGVERVLAGGRYFCSEASGLLAEALRSPGADDALTPRQKEIVQRVARGQSSREIAIELGLSEKTVQNHRMQIRQRLNLHDVASLTRYAIEQGLVEPKA